MPRKRPPLPLSLALLLIPSLSPADNLEQAATDLCTCFGKTSDMSSELVEALNQAKASGDLSLVLQYPLIENGYLFNQITALALWLENE